MLIESRTLAPAKGNANDHRGERLLTSFYRRAAESFIACPINDPRTPRVFVDSTKVFDVMTEKLRNVRLLLRFRVADCFDTNCIFCIFLKN